MPIILCKTSDSLHLFKIKGTLKPEDIKLNKNYLWDTLEIDCNGIKLSFNGNEIVLCKAVWSNLLILMCLGVIILGMIVCTALHNCLSSGSLFFASLRQNN